MTDATATSDRARTVAEVKVVLDLEQAVSLSRYRVRVTGRLGDRMTGRLFKRLPPHLLSELRDLIGHLSLIFLVPRTLLSADVVVVRGFRTKMAALAALLLWPFRTRMVFLVHQNVQYAHVSTAERTAFLMLCGMGFRFGLFEGEDGLAELGIAVRGDRFVTLPLPVASNPKAPLAGDGVRPKVGVIGRALKEKNSRDLLRMLVAARDARRLGADVFFASNSDSQRQAWSEAGFETRDSTDYAAYVAAIRSVDVLLVNYDRTFYFYRSSGVINDGAGNGTAVVCPDFPVFRHQVRSPVSVGATFTDGKDLPAAIAKAAELARRHPENFGLWAEVRSPETFAARLDEFLARSTPRLTPTRSG